MVGRGEALLKAPENLSAGIPTGGGDGPSPVPAGEVPEFIKDLVVEIQPSGERRARLKLEPPDLGELDIDLKVHRQEVSVFLRVEKPEALHQLQPHLPHLQHLLEDLGFNVLECQVSLGGAGQGWHFAEERGRESSGEKAPSIKAVEEVPAEKEPASGVASGRGINLVV
ncbi:flagellar hook-length control protein FliK [Thermosulfurimonas marina]|uniref:flagellar hook-length control protein FliK n=1 Tax=Thermosulfurimonas marina TaxID=2047767 RepID=UPI00144AD179|nr:flagellar hook-length control protein FliK [Thermosulfurimonas marina]